MVFLSRSASLKDEILAYLISDSCVKDVKIVCSDGSIVAHRVILTHWSSLLYEILKDPLKDTILLPDFETSTVDAVLQLLCGIEAVALNQLQAKSLLRLLGVTKCAIEEVSAGHQVNVGGNSSGRVVLTDMCEIVYEGSSTNNEDGKPTGQSESIACDLVMQAATSTSLDQMDKDDSDDTTLQNSEKKNTYETSAKETKRNYRCFLCTETFPSLGLRQGHMLQVHPDNRPATCPLCAVESTQGNIHKHLQSKHGRTFVELVPYSCRFCSSIFRKSQELGAHIRKCRPTKLAQLRITAQERKKKTQGKTLIHRCSWCPMTFLFEQGLKTHLQQGHKLDEKEAFPFGCNKCKKSFHHLEHLQFHTCQEKKLPEPSPSTSTSLQGSTAGASCRNVGAPNRKIEELADYKPIPIGKCLICNTILPNKREYLIHFHHVHQGKGDHACDICGKVFSSRNKCILHHAVHNPVKQFQCEACFKEFSLKYQLTYHQKHTCAILGAFMQN